MKNFLAICGVSGVGKTTIIKEIIKHKNFFEYIKPDTNRVLRKNEIDKNHLNIDEIKQNIKENKYIIVNKLYGNYYCTPKKTINQILNNGHVPILDFPISEIDKLFSYMKRENVLVIYLLPPSISELKTRLNKDSRDLENIRFKEGIKEIINIDKYADKVDKFIVNTNLEKAIQTILNYCNIYFSKNIK